MRIPLLFPVLAVVLIVACEAQDSNLLSPDSPIPVIGTPRGNHDGSGSANAHFVGVQEITQTTARVIWHDTAVASDYHVKVCVGTTTNDSCPSGTLLNVTATSGTNWTTANHRYYDLSSLSPGTSYTAFVKANGISGPSSFKQFVFFQFTTLSNTPVNNPPVILTLDVDPNPADEGQTIDFDATASDADGDPLTFDWDFDDGGTATGASVQHAFDDNGSYTVTLTVSDGEEEVGTFEVVIVNNVSPTADYSAPSSVDEGSPYLVSLTNPYDPSGADVTAGFTYSFDCDDDGIFEAVGAAASHSCPTTDDAVLDVRARIEDKDGDYTDYTGQVTVQNVAPDLGGITIQPGAVVEIGTPITASAAFTDPGTDTWTATIDWGDGTGPQNLGSVTSPIVAGPKTYSSAGVYVVTMTVTDDDGDSDVETYSYVVVYDPSAGFVTGGGWILYDTYSCPILCDGVTGKGEFGFVSRYKKGATMPPEGNTRFEFHAGSLLFESTSYDYLVVAGSRAQFKGVGTINGAGNYGFMLVAIDGTPDKFRIKFSDIASGVTVFDNKWGASETGNDATALDKVNGNGSIVIHTSKK